MQLKENMMAVVSTGKERLGLWVKTLRDYLVKHNEYMDTFSKTVDIYGRIESVKDETSEEIHAEIAAIQEEIAETSESELNKTFSFSGPNGNVYILEASKDGITSEYNVDLSMLDDNEQIQAIGNLVNTSTETLEAIARGEKTVEDTLEGLDISVQDIANSLSDTLIATTVVERASTLYSQGIFSIESLRASVSDILSVSNDKIQTILQMIIDSFKNLTLSYDTFIGGMKGLLNQIISAIRIPGKSKFQYGVDTWEVKCHVFLGTDAVLAIVSSITSLILAIAYPVVGIVAMAVSSGISKVKELIDENVSDVPTYPEDPDFSGFGQNVFRAYSPVYNLINKEVDSVIGVQTPISTSLIYNDSIQNSQHIDLFPCQEFLIPVIPITSQAWEAFRTIFTSNMTINSSEEWVTDSSKSYYRDTMNIYAGAGQSSSTKNQRALYAASFLQYMNNVPEHFYWPAQGSDPYVLQLGLAFSFTIWNLLVGNDSNEVIASYSIIADHNKADNTFADFSSTYFMKRGFYENAISLCTMVLAYINDHGEYNPETGMTQSDFIRHIMEDGSEHNAYYISEIYLPTWMTFVNQDLVSFISIKSIASEINNGALHDVIPYAILDYSGISTFNPSILPPAHRLNIWVRVAITTAVIAGVAIASAIAYAKLRKVAIRSFMKNADIAHNNYVDWLNTNDPKSYRAYRKATKRANFLGSVFNIGSLDVANNWINAPAASVASTVDNIAGLASNGQPVSNEQLASLVTALENLVNDVKKLISR